MFKQFVKMFFFKLCLLSCHEFEFCHFCCIVLLKVKWENVQFGDAKFGLGCVILSNLGLGLHEFAFKIRISDARILDTY